MYTYLGILTNFFIQQIHVVLKYLYFLTFYINRYIMIHSFGQKILYPWSYTSFLVHDWEDLATMGEIMARNIERHSGLDYKVGSSPRIQYLAAGGSDDWAKGEMGIKWVFLLELPDKGYHGFLLPAYHIKPTSESIFQGIRALGVEISHTLAY